MSNRKRKPCCQRCRHRGYWRAPGYQRLTGNGWITVPSYWCDRCHDSWSDGHYGGEYAGHEMNADGPDKEAPRK